MLFKGKKKKYFIASLLILPVMASFLVFGCKGKETTQPSSETPQSEQQAQGQAEPSPSSDVTTQGQGSSAGTQGSAGDTPPRITSFNVTPKTPVIGDRIKAEVTTFDREGDDVSLEYEWTKNDSHLPESSDTLLVSKDFRKGDKIALKVTPGDGKMTGTPMTMFFVVADSPPVINPSSETFGLRGNLYSYQVKASDPDGDRLTYSLTSCPKGMTINPSTGLIQWNVPEGYKGEETVTVSVSDGHGGVTSQSFTLNISPE